MAAAPACFPGPVIQQAEKGQQLVPSLCIMAVIIGCIET